MILNQNQNLGKKKIYQKNEEFELELFEQERFVVLNGEAELTINDKTYELKKDDCVFISKLAQYKWKIKKDLEIKYIFDISNNSI